MNRDLPGNPAESSGLQNGRAHHCSATQPGICLCLGCSRSGNTDVATRLSSKNAICASSPTTSWVQLSAAQLFLPLATSSWGFRKDIFASLCIPFWSICFLRKKWQKPSNNRNALLVPVLGTEHWQVCQHPQHGVFHLCFHFCCSLQKANPCNTRNAHFFLKTQLHLKLVFFHVSVSESCRVKICVFCTSGLQPLHSHRCSHLGLTSHRVPP